MKLFHFANINDLLFRRKYFRQLQIYAAVGISISSASYLLYLFLTNIGVSPIVVVAICYPVIATISFLANKKITFSHGGDIGKSGFKYICAHVIACLLNIAMLEIFSRTLGWPHQIVQAAAVFVVAGFLFVSMKFFVFKE